VPETNKDNRYIYGPVPSRRLGFSLGVDLVPYKVCTFDCIYCQLGKTTQKTIQRSEYFKKDEILSQIKNAISLKQKIDYITFSGSGEPTLNTGIGYLINEVKKMTDIPVAVLTNGSLLYDERVRKALLPANLVIPSLDAATEDSFKKINQPHKSVTFEKMVTGLLDFRKQYKGKIWLEIMLVKGINDSKKEVELFRTITAKGAFDKIQLNTVVRPPSDAKAVPLSIDRLWEIKNFLGENCEIIPKFKREKQEESIKENKKRILELLKRRPVTLSNISTALGINRNEAIKYLDIFRKNGIVKILNFEGKIFYEIK